MKKLLTTIAIFLSLSAMAQPGMFGRHMDTTVINNDTILSRRGAIQIQPVIVTVNGDSAWSVFWVVNNVTSDTSIGSYASVTFYGKNGNQLSEKGIEIPASVVNDWVENSSITDYIFTHKDFIRFKRR